MGEMVEFLKSNSIDNNVVSLIKGNDMFSKFKGTDLKELIDLIENFYLIYRTTLDLEDNVTFGTEIEYERLSKSLVDKYIKINYSDWISTDEGSINYGGEVISPKLTDSKKCWEDLRNICMFLRENKARTLEKAGSHIHVGAHIMDGDLDKCFNLLETYVGYEKIIARFLYGENICARKYMVSYIKSLTKKFAYANYDHLTGKLEFNSINYVLNTLSKGYVIRTKHTDLSKTEEKGNTIEFRGANGTLEEIIWQNNINAVTKLMLALKNNKVDMDLVRYKIKNEFIDNLNDDNLFNKIYIDDALEFVDMVFDNNLDKVYFLRQYFKNFETVLDSKKLVKASNFIDNLNLIKINVA